MLRLGVRKAADYTVYLVVRLAAALVQATTMEALDAFSHVAAWFCYDIARARRKLIDDNLAHAFPQLSDRERRSIGLGMWRHLFLLLCEIAHAPRKIHETNWRKYVRIHRKREIVSALLDTRPKVLVSGHFGNFEVGGYINGVLGLTTHTVARTLDNPYLDEYLRKFREAKLQFILPKSGSAPEADAVLKTGGTLVLLGDQHAGPKGCWVEFMNRPASCHKALSLFTLLSGAPMIVAWCRRRERPMQFEMGLADVADPAHSLGDLADARQLSQWHMDFLAEQIRERPDQYWWLHRLWREVPSPKILKQLASRLPVAAADEKRAA
jgi:KDO2-lipid IV(A) lauroyltransferase